jgi:hypothetical protein
MQKFKHKRQGLAVCAGFVLGMYVFFLFAPAFHHWVGTDHKHDRPTCQHPVGEKHIHSEEYATEGCALCQVVLAYPDLPEFFRPVFLNRLLLLRSTFHAQSSWVGRLRHGRFMPRAPPVFKG